MNLKRRLAQLERGRDSIALEPIRVVVGGCVGTASLATARCTRTLCTNGQLVEVVHLDGNVRELNPEDLDQFVSRVPIQQLTH